MGITILSLLIVWLGFKYACEWVSLWLSDTDKDTIVYFAQNRAELLPPEKQVYVGVW